MARRPHRRHVPRRRTSVIVPLLVAVSAGTMTWAGLSSLGGAHGLHVLFHRAEAWIGGLSEAVADTIATPAHLSAEEGSTTAPGMATAAIPAPLPGPAVVVAPPPAVAAAVPAVARAAANEPAELAPEPAQPQPQPAAAAPPAPAATLPPPEGLAVASFDAPSPLAPLDLSSPRATLRSFRDTIDRVYRNLTSGPRTAETAIANRHLVAQLLTTLDLEEVAPSLAESKGREATTCLKEVFDRIPLPPDTAFPDAAAVKADSITRFRVPGTEIMLVRLEAGQRQGDFVFSRETVNRAEGFFSRVRSLPYKPDAGSPGLYDAYVTVGGNLIPESLIRRLPHWAHTVVLGETVWQWCAATLLALAFGLVALLACRLPRCFRPGWMRSVASFSLPAVLAAGSLLTDWLLTMQVRLTGESLIAAKLGLRLTLYAGAIAAVMAVMERVTEILVRAWSRRGDGIDVQLLRLGCRVCTFVVVAWIGIQAADSLGVPVAPLLAGLGASGLAVALAAQYSIENLIAGVVLFTDKPVRIGDECQYGDIRGRVEQIGLRSTRIRGLDRSLVTIPNAEFAKVQLVNYTRRDRIPIKLPVQVRPDASPRLVRELLERFRDLLADHEQLDPGSRRVRLTGQSADALSIEISALALTSDEGEMQAIREELLLSIMDEIDRRRAGLDGDETESPVLRAA